MREAEVVAYLREDEALAALVPGGIYAASDLGVSGITDAITTPDAWAGGFQPTIVVHQRSAVPSGLLVDFKTQASDSNQVVEIYVYALEVADVETVLDAVYGLVQGYKFDSAWRANWTGTVGVLDAPELPPGTRMARMDFTIKSIRRPVVAD
jgi:hypothetical protein